MSAELSECNISEALKLLFTSKSKRECAVLSSISSKTGLSLDNASLILSRIVDMGLLRTTLFSGLNSFRLTPELRKILHDDSQRLTLATNVFSYLIERTVGRGVSSPESTVLSSPSCHSSDLSFFRQNMDLSFKDLEPSYNNTQCADSQLVSARTSSIHSLVIIDEHVEDSNLDSSALVINVLDEALGDDPFPSLNTVKESRELHLSSFSCLGDFLLERDFYLSNFHSASADSFLKKTILADTRISLRKIARSLRKRAKRGSPVLLVDSVEVDSIACPCIPYAGVFMGFDGTSFSNCRSACTYNFLHSFRTFRPDLPTARVTLDQKDTRFLRKPASHQKFANISGFRFESRRTDTFPYVSPRGAKPRNFQTGFTRPTVKKQQTKRKPGTKLFHISGLASLSSSPEVPRGPKNRYSNLPVRTLSRSNSSRSLVDKILHPSRPPRAHPRVSVLETLKNRDSFSPRRDHHVASSSFQGLVDLPSASASENLQLSEDVPDNTSPSISASASQSTLLQTTVDMLDNFTQTSGLDSEVQLRDTTCPFCQVPHRSYKSLAKHLVAKHLSINNAQTVNLRCHYCSAVFPSFRAHEYVAHETSHEAATVPSSLVLQCHARSLSYPVRSPSHMSSEEISSFISQTLDPSTLRVMDSSTIFDLSIMHAALECLCHCPALGDFLLHPILFLQFTSWGLPYDVINQHLTINRQWKRVSLPIFLEDSSEWIGVLITRYPRQILLLDPRPFERQCIPIWLDRAIRDFASLCCPLDPPAKKTRSWKLQKVHLDCSTTSVPDSGPYVCTLIIRLITSSKSQTFDSSIPEVRLARSAIHDLLVSNSCSLFFGSMAKSRWDKKASVNRNIASANPFSSLPHNKVPEPSVCSFSKPPNLSLRKSYDLSKRATVASFVSPTCHLRLVLSEVEEYQSALLRSFSGRSFDTRCLYGLPNAPQASSICSEVTGVMIIETINNLLQKGASSPGPDGLTYADWLAIDPDGSFLASVMNHSISSGVVPDVWKVSYVRLIPKGSCLSPSSLDDLRPIATTNTAYRVFTAILNERLMHLAECHGWLSDCQRGFRKIDGCMINTFLLDESIAQASSQNLPRTFIFFDIRKAFDCVPHSAVISVLEYLGLDEASVRLINAIIASSEVRFHTDDGLTCPLQLQAGVKQGDPISPLLFSIVFDVAIKQLSRWLASNVPHDYEILAFADDVALCCPTVFTQEAINVFHTHLGYLGLSLNPKKCQSLTIDHGRVAPKVFTVNDSPIFTCSQIDSVKYLGLDKDTRFFKPLTSRLASALSLANQIAGSGLMPWQKIDALKVFVLSKIAYHLKLQSSDIDELGSFRQHIKDLLRSILDLPPHSSVSFLFGSQTMGCLGFPDPVTRLCVLSLMNGLSLLAASNKVPTDVRNKVRMSLLSYSGLASTSCERPLTSELLERINAILSGDETSFPKGHLWFRMLQAVRILRQTARVSIRLLPDWRVQLILGDDVVTIDASKSSSLCSRVMSFASLEVARAFVDSDHFQARLMPAGLDPISYSWLSNGQYLGPNDYIAMIKGRLNLFSFNAVPSPGQSYRSSPLCRRCHSSNETIGHVLCQCHFSLSRYATDRHNAVIKRITNALSIFSDLSVTLDRPVPGFDSNVRPDMIVRNVKEKWAIIIDVTIIADIKRASEAADMKKVKYAALSQFISRQEGVACKTEALVIGALGFWPQLNDNVLRLLPIPSQFIGKMKTLIIANVMQMSRYILYRHFYGESYLANPPVLHSL